MDDNQKAIPCPFAAKGGDEQYPCQTGRKLILVIDDDPVFRTAIGMKLKAACYDVITAEDGSSAVAAAGRIKPDLILLDLNFPPDVGHGGGLGWDGFLILQWLRRTRLAIDVPVIAVTAADTNRYTGHCQEAGILDLLAKPVDHEILLARIRTALHQPQASTGQTASPSTFQQARRILVVDDEDRWHQMAVQRLHALGYEVIAAHNAEEALREAARIRPDVIIVDLKLEKASGLGIMRFLVAAHPSVPLLVYAGLGLPQWAREELINQGAFQILQKRSMDELQRAVQAAWDRPRQTDNLLGPMLGMAGPSPAGKAKLGFDNILIVEDEQTFSQLLQTFLESHGLLVTCVPNAIEALRQVSATNFDVIISDMVLPGPSGEDFYHEVERAHPELCRRFIFMTGHDADPRSDDFIRRARAVMLWKPFLLTDLLSAAQTVQRKNRLTHALQNRRPLVSQ